MLATNKIVYLRKTTLNKMIRQIVTTNQTDSFEEDGKHIRLMPANQFLLS